jgi:hypothetical protein
VLSFQGTRGCNSGAGEVGFLRRPVAGNPPRKRLRNAKGTTFIPKGLDREKTKRHGQVRASFASVRFGRSIVFVLSARPATAAGCFTTFSSRDSGLFAREFVRGSFLVGGAPTLGSDCALRLGIHCRESAGSLSTRTACTTFRSALSSVHRATSASIISSDPLVHHVLSVVSLVCHY